MILLRAPYLKSYFNQSHYCLFLGFNVNTFTAHIWSNQKTSQYLTLRILLHSHDFEVIAQTAVPGVVLCDFFPGSRTHISILNQ